MQYEGIRPEHVAVRGRRGRLRRLAHGRGRDQRARRRSSSCSALLSNDVSRIAVGGAQYSVLCREDGGVLDDLFTYRLGEDRFLTVTNASNHEKDFAWMSDQGASFDAELADRAADYAMLAVQGPTAREIVQTLADAPLPERMRAARAHHRRRAGARLRHGLHRRGRRRAAAAPPSDAAAVWDRLLNAGAAPAGLGRARHAAPRGLLPPLRQRPLGGRAARSRPAWAGAARRTPASSAPTPSARAREAGPRRSSPRSSSTGPGIARQGNPVVGGGEVTSGTLSPSLGVGIGMAYLPAERGRARAPRSRSTSAAARARPPSARSRCTAPQ